MSSRFYTGDGKEYDAFVGCIPYHGDFQSLIATTLRDRLGKANRPRILEVGCGTGFTTEKVAAIFPEAKIIATDNDCGMLAVAIERLRGFKNVEPMEVDIFDIIDDFSPGDFDAVVSGYCAHNLTPFWRAMLFQKIGRVVKKGGAVVIGDKIARNDIVLHWNDLELGIASFEQLRGTDFAHLKGFWIQHYLNDDAIRLTESEQEVLFRMAWCDDIVLHRRWGFDAVMSGIRVNA